MVRRRSAGVGRVLEEGGDGETMDAVVRRFWSSAKPLRPYVNTTGPDRASTTAETARVIDLVPRFASLKARRDRS